MSLAYPSRNLVQLVGLKRAIDAKRIGKPLTGTYTYLQSNGPRHKVDTTRRNLALVAGGDDTMFLGYGVLDLEWLARSRIEVVHARGGAFFYRDYRTAGINDLTHVTFTMRSGFVGSITVGRITVKNRPALRSIDISGTHGAVSVDFSKDRILGHCPTGVRQIGVPQDPVPVLVDDFVRAALAGRRAQYTVEDAFHTVAVQEAVRRSVRTGRAERVATP